MTTTRLIVDRPEPGYYWRRLCKGGPRVPVMICVMEARDPETGEALDRSPTLLCLVAGEQADPLENWVSCANHPISVEDYNLMLAQCIWDRQHAPGSPGANPKQPVDVRKLPPAF